VTAPAEPDAVLVVSFGGPEGPDDVLPFLRNVTRGRDVPDARLQTVAEQYRRFGGVSPINAHTRALVGALQDLLQREGPALPVYWGNRNWAPMVEDTVAQMAQDGVGHAVAFVTSAYSSYSGCRQYIDDIERARAHARPHGAVPSIAKLRPYFNHPGFIEPMSDNVQRAIDRLPTAARAGAALAFTAHSIPAAMAVGCDYEAQLEEAARLITERLAVALPHRVVYQSRSGPPHHRWLGPDIGGHLGALAADGATAVVVAPIGFVADHMEVIYDLDVVAAAAARDAGLPMQRAATVGTDGRFVAMIRELVLELPSHGGTPPRALGVLGPRRFPCADGCCPPGAG
jgi:ferrochelatase